MVVAGRTSYSENGAGYTLYYDGSSPTNPTDLLWGAEGFSIVQQVSMPDEYIDNEPIKLSAWVGISRDYDGGPQLLQGGWAVTYLWDASQFVYYTWIELYPPEPANPIAPVNPGDEVHASAYMVDKSLGHGRICIWVYGSTSIQFCQDYQLNEDASNVRYAHFIVETPYTPAVEDYARLPKFNTIKISDVSVVLSDGYSYTVTKGSSLINAGYYFKWILQQGNYTNVDVSYDSTDESVVVQYITSKR